MSTQVAAIILAAGKGTRMKSSLHKVLHPIASRPMLMHLLGSFDELKPTATVVVAGDKREQLEAALAGRNVSVAVQDPQLGTAHAALQAKDALAGFEGLVLVCFGDVPFLRAETVRRLCAALDGGAMVAVLGFRPEDMAAYGRIIADADGNVQKMVEHKDATDTERAVNLCNSGVIVAHSRDMWRLLESVGNDNAAGEYYLPDVATNAMAEGGRVVVIETDAGGGHQQPRRTGGHGSAVAGGAARGGDGRWRDADCARNRLVCVGYEAGSRCPDRAQCFFRARCDGGR
jgi:bifunctional UDP-N-acetylglucosamine pyrophosphorylase / glucosamine-1-phosphate N-acetyltransferase